MTVRIVKGSASLSGAAASALFERPAFDSHAERIARKVLADIKRSGMQAVLRYARRFDGVKLTARTLRVTAAEMRRAESQVRPECRRAVHDAHRRIAAFARAGIRKDWSIPTRNGGRLGERFVALSRVGVYVPGGKAPLASTALMTATLAQTAGVEDVVACTPCGPDGRINPVLLYALSVAGATEIYRVGGVQAIGLMAYGAGAVRKVDKIVGPGGTFVTAAKRLVYGEVALDLVAGPSEIAVFADAMADPRFVAADLLSQAEHGTGWERALLVTPSMRLAIRVRTELEIQVGKLSRRRAARRVMRRGMLLIVVRDLVEGMDVCNRFAPEHLELMVKNPRQWLKKVRNAGAVFLGPWSPESAGDFAAGPSHVLPTGGTASKFSGLTVDDFRKRTSVIAFTRRDLHDALFVIQQFGDIEGLDGHARAAEIRCVKMDG